jgi:hypothetical protein
MKASEENKRFAEERERELRAREEVRLVKEDALKNHKRLSHLV